MSYNALQVYFEKVYYTFVEKPDEIYWAKMNEEFVAFVGKWLEHLEERCR